MDYTIDHAVNVVVRSHPLLGSILAGFSDYGVIAFGIAAVGLWLLTPPGQAGPWKLASTAGLSAAALGLVLAQLITHVWDRARPYDAHPHGIVPLLARSSDPSFPSDHATAAFGIAFGIWFIHRRAGWLFLAMAALISVSRVATGMHYPTDVLAGAGIGVAAGYFTAMVAMESVLMPLILLLSRITDPAIARLASLRPIRATLLQPRVRASIVLTAGGLLTIYFGNAMERHLTDELPLSVLGAWLAVVAGASFIARQRFYPSSTARSR